MKFVWFYPVKTTSTKETISKLKIQQAIFGNPAWIISDCGTAFTSNDFGNYLEDENIEHVLFTTGIRRGTEKLSEYKRPSYQFSLNCLLMTTGIGINMYQLFNGLWIVRVLKAVSAHTLWAFN